MTAAQVTDLFLALVDRIAHSFSVLVTTGTTVTASPNVTAVASETGVAIGDVISGLDIVAGTTVIDLDQVAGTLTMSAPATVGHVTTPLTFTRAGPLGSVFVDLFTNSPALSVASVLADLTVPTYTGYAAQTVAVEAVQRSANNDYLDKYATAHFQPTNNVGLPQTMNGFAVSATIGGVKSLMYAQYFAAPLAFLDSTTGLDLIIEGEIMNLLNWGGLCTFC